MTSIIPIDNEKENICIFCLVDMGVTEKNTNIFGCQCNVSYHDECMLQWIQQSDMTCPLCRRSNFSIIREQVEQEREEILNRNVIKIIWFLLCMFLNTIMIVLFMYLRQKSYVKE